MREVEKEQESFSVESFSKGSGLRMGNDNDKLLTKRLGGQPDC